MDPISGLDSYYLLTLTPNQYYLFYEEEAASKETSKIQDSSYSILKTKRDSLFLGGLSFFFYAFVLDIIFLLSLKLAFCALKINIFGFYKKNLPYL